MLAAATRMERQVALLMLDIDGFKSVNDTLGPEAGDRLLQEIAQRVGRRLRQADTVARFGGDKFVVLIELAHDHLDAIFVAENVIKVNRRDRPLPRRGPAHRRELRHRLLHAQRLACADGQRHPRARRPRHVRSQARGQRRLPHRAVMPNYGRTAGASIFMPARAT